MSLTVAPKVNLDSLQNLQADKQYFLSSTTGEIKEASIWMRFKCAIGVNSARQKVANLMDAVRTSLLDAARLDGNAALDENIRAVNMRYMVKGSDIKDIARRFSVDNANGMAKDEARRIVLRDAKIRVAGLRGTHFNLGSDSALCKIIKHALKPTLNNLPMTTDSKGNAILDTEAFNNRMYEPMNAARELLDQLSRVDPKGEDIDEVYADYIIKTLFNEDGTRNEKPVTAVKGKLQAQVDYAFHVKGKALGSRAESVYSTLMDMGKAQGKDDFPGEMLQKILGYCGDKDVMLRRYVLEIAPELCVDSNYNLRSDATIKARVEALRANMDEIRTISKTIPGFAKMAQMGLAVLGGKAFPPGLLTEMANGVKNAKLDTLSKLNSFSTPEQIYKAVEEIRDAIQQFGKRVDVLARFENDGEAEVGGPQTIATKTVMMAMSLAKAGPGLLARLPSIVKGENFGKMNSFISQLLGDLNNGSVTFENTSKTSGVLDEQLKISSFMVDVASSGREAQIEPQEVEINYQQDDSVGFMLGELSTAVAKV